MNKYKKKLLHWEEMYKQLEDLDNNIIHERIDELAEWFGSLDARITALEEKNDS